LLFPFFKKKINYFRDIFKTKMRTYSEEMVPFVSSLLQSVVLHPNSLCLIIESLSLCVETEIIDTRASMNL
jgi:hypothetical protein